MKNRNIVLRSVVKDMIFEIDNEFLYNLYFLENRKDLVNESLNKLVMNTKLYKQHKRFIKHFMINGYSIFKNKYKSYCDKNITKMYNISTNEHREALMNSKTMKNSFKSFLTSEHDEKIRKIYKVLNLIEQDNEYIKLIENFYKMVDLKDAIEEDIKTEKESLNILIFEELQERIREYEIDFIKYWES